MDLINTVLTVLSYALVGGLASCVSVFVTLKAVRRKENAAAADMEEVAEAKAIQNDQNRLAFYGNLINDLTNRLNDMVVRAGDAERINKEITSINNTLEKKYNELKTKYNELENKYIELEKQYEELKKKKE